MTAMRNRPDPCSQALSAQDFIRCLEQMLKLAYGRDKMSDDTHETLLHSQLQEGLMIKAPAVSGSHGYPELCLAAWNEERHLAEPAE